MSHKTSTNLSGELGNTITNSPKKTMKKYRKWCFTLNNYTEIEYNELLNILTSKTSYKYIIGKEIGKENNTPHLQGYIESKNQITFNTLKNINNRLHLEKANGTRKQNIIYCSKDNNYITNFNMNLYIDKNSYLLNLEYNNITWNNFQKDILNIIDNNKPHNRKINWYYEKKGNVGKSFLCKYISLKYKNVIISEGKKDNIYNQVLTLLNNENYDITKRIIILLDISRHNLDYINYGCIESLKNGCFYSGKYEGGNCIYPIPFVFIFSNEEPDLYKWSKDRYNIIKINS